MTIPVVVSGAKGRLGARILSLCQAEEGVEVRAELTREYDGHDFAAGEVLIETGPNGAALAHGDSAAQAGAGILMATTGFRSADEARFEAWAQKVPFLLAPNLSLGVNLMLDLVRRAAGALADYDLEVLEIHHRKKQDAPSGTAWALAQAAAEGRGQDDLDRRAAHARAGMIGARSDEEVGMMVLRGGDVIGEHTVYLFGETERVELTHRAANRDAFARGALTAARFLAQQPPGHYTMRDVLSL
ncbi:MAG: 4-hydroxy-tetrahydrodipicolinate reductase [Myxococcota bacterium]